MPRPPWWTLVAALLASLAREPWIEMARTRRKWRTIEDGALRVDLPASGPCAARLLREWTRQATQGESSGRELLVLVSHLSSMRAADERIVLEWKLDGPTFTLPPRRGAEHEGEFAARLRASPDLQAPLPSRAEIEARFARR